MNQQEVRNIAQSEARRIGFGVHDFGMVQTTDATPAVIAHLDIDDATGGILSITVVGEADDASAVVTGEWRIRFRKNGALVLGSLVNVMPLVDDFSACTISVVNVSDNIEVQVIGTAAVINWVCRTQLFFTNGNPVPR